MGDRRNASRNQSAQKSTHQSIRASKTADSAKQSTMPSANQARSPVNESFDVSPNEASNQPPSGRIKGPINRRTGVIYDSTIARIKGPVNQRTIDCANSGAGQPINAWMFARITHSPNRPVNSATPIPNAQDLGNKQNNEADSGCVCFPLFAIQLTIWEVWI